MKTLEHLAGTEGETFTNFSDSQLRQFINGCHKSRDYAEQFRAACAELNRRG